MKDNETGSITGSCHCGNVKFTAQSATDLSEFNPRACDCSFCSKHGAGFFSDPDGELSFLVQNGAEFKRYQHGSRQAVFMVCKSCGVLVGVMAKIDGIAYAAINTRALDAAHSTADAVTTSPESLSAEERLARWKSRWFKAVTMNTVTA